MEENGSVGPRAEFLVRVQRFSDEMLDSLEVASRGKDVDEKEARALRNALLELFEIWDKALLEGYRDSALEEKRSLQVKEGDA
jgi:hypothetical protein